jgi:hypothetical protein
MCSDPTLYKEKPTIIVSPVVVQLSDESQPVKRRLGTGKEEFMCAVFTVRLL